MKKLLFLILLIPNLSLARERESLGNIGPAWLSGTTSTATTISAGGSGNYNCIDYVVAFATNTFTVYILDSGTTNYSIPVAASIVHTKDFSPELCGSANTAMTLKNVAATGTTVNLSYQGFVGR